jgi:serine/threonine protein kinase
VHELAQHGTTAIGSPPYMATEQFHGNAVFASDLYSLGVTMYQMLTGILPYETPSPGELQKLMTGELVSPPRLRNPKIPKSVNDIVLKAMAPAIGSRYQRASDLLSDILALGRESSARRPAKVVTPEPANVAGSAQMHDIHSRLRARETPQGRFCWHCRKPLHARSDRCPFCGETQ